MKVHWAEAAGADRNRIWSFIADYDVERADRIEAMLLAEAEYLARHPTFGRPVDTFGRRDWTMVKHPYVLRYRVDEEMDTLRILRVWHGRENREG